MRNNRKRNKTHKEQDEQLFLDKFAFRLASRKARLQIDNNRTP